MSTLVLDTITGKSTATTITIGSTPVVSASATSMTIRGEGSAQTSIQQGLAKAWCLGAIDAALVDSFNISGGVDNGTGDYTYSFTTAFGSNNIAPSGNCVSDENIILVYTQGALLSTAYRVELRNDSTGDQNEINSTNICGDLA